jgi:hypothetical protein
MGLLSMQQWAWGLSLLALCLPALRVLLPRSRRGELLPWLAMMLGLLGLAWILSQVPMWVLPSHWESWG